MRQLICVLLFSTFLFGAASTKARKFNGTSDSLQSASAVDFGQSGTNQQLSLSFWLWWDSFSNNDALAGELSSNYNTVPGAFLLDPNSSATSAWDANVQSGSGFLLMNFTRPTAGAWHHYLIVWDGSVTTNCTNSTVYVDGSVATGLSCTSSGHTFVFDNDTLNLMSRNNASLFGAGRISDIWFWKTLLTSGNASTLAGCGDPSSISGANQIFAWPIKQVSPETPSVGAVNLTVNGTTNVASNCTGTTTPAPRNHSGWQ